ncbi:MAG: hypothetical protein LBP25_01455 [Tannerellaceae bacterium]|jgi:hypothetical protein|nr:hypothetical protein [Tannerellaceae bacterium]
MIVLYPFWELSKTVMIMLYPFWELSKTVLNIIFPIFELKKDSFDRKDEGSPEETFVSIPYPLLSVNIACSAKMAIRKTVLSGSIQKKRLTFAIIKDTPK